MPFSKDKYFTSGTVGVLGLQINKNSWFNDIRKFEII